MSGVWSVDRHWTAIGHWDINCGFKKKKKKGVQNAISSV
jgi:hypothetical protein